MYVDIVTSTEPAEVLTVLNHFRTIRRAVEDARDMVDLPDDYVEGEFEDPDRHFAEYVSHKGRATVRVRFRHEETARTFRYDGVPNDFDALPLHDERFRHNAHTRKVDVAVPIDE